jgi:hypothetical protein
MNETTIAPAAGVHECWATDAPRTTDYTELCVSLAREALEHYGYDRFEDSPYEDVIACHLGGEAVTVNVLCLPAEAWEMTAADVESLMDDEFVMRGASLCVARELLGEGEPSDRLRFDVMSVCLNPQAARVRVHHIIGAWQS